MHTIDFKYLPKDINLKVLDAGCGDGRHLQVARHYGFQKLYGIDQDLISLNKVKDRFENEAPFIQQGNIEQLPFSNESFDIVICSEVLEHVDNVEKALQNLYSVTRKGGSCAISVPRFWTEKICWLLSKEYPHTPGGHLRIFKTKELEKLIKKVGFKIVKKHYAHAFHSPYWWLRCVFWKTQDSNLLIKYFEKVLVKIMFKYGLKTHPLESILNPILGKSIVLYTQK